MKFQVIIDPDCEEKVVVHIRQASPLIPALQSLTAQYTTELLGYLDSEIVKLNPADICCFSITDGKVYALCGNNRYQIKERLYTLEEKLPDTFVKIHQSCLANIRQMERFDTSISGTLKIRFKNGHTDYVSRRQLKLIKERLGI